MSIYFVAGAYQPGFTGWMAVAPDNLSSTSSYSATTLALPVDVVSLSDGENMAYQDLIDNSSLLHNKNPGLHMGNLQCSGPLKTDRGFETIINTGFGTRASSATGGLLPWLATFKPNALTDAFATSGLWFSDLSIQGRFAVGGEPSRVTYALTGMVLDPDNTLGAPVLDVSSLAGQIGIGTSTFLNCSFSDGGTDGISGAPAIYDGITSFSIRLSNSLMVQKSAYPGHTDARIAAGCAPGTLKGSVNFTQMVGAVNPLPQVTNDTSYPIVVTIQSGTNSADYLTLDLSVSYDAKSEDIVATDFNTIPVSYSLFAGSGAQPTYPIYATYTHA